MQRDIRFLLLLVGRVVLSVGERGDMYHVAVQTVEIFLSIS